MSDPTTPTQPLSGPGIEAEANSPASPEAVTRSNRIPPASAEAWPTLPGYEILGELGRGGMGVVYQARQIGLKRLVALKMILAGQYAGPEQCQRFRSEAEAVARLRHPNIVQIYEVGEQAGRLFFSLEYVEGGSLARKLAGIPLPAREAAQLVEQLAAGIQHAHQQGIIHRDLKPANILLAWEGEAPAEPISSGSAGASPSRWAPKITDFGLAKQLPPPTSSQESAAGSDLTQPGIIMGSPPWMAPEQARGQAREVGPAADIYALGAILYETLTGRPPFRAATQLETLQLVLHEEPLPPTRLNPKVPRDLETICLKCLPKEPQQRYLSAQALAEDLRRFQDGEPIRARPTSGWERLRKWAWRRPAVAALTAAICLVTVLAFVLVTWKWREALAALDRADQAARAETEARLREEQQSRAVEMARRVDYCSRVASAAQKWLANDVGKAEEILDSCPADLRDWEWHFGKRRCHAERAGFQAENAPVNAVAFSPDGKRLATGGGEVLREKEKGLVKVWDSAEFRDPLILRGHTGAVTSLAFFPDGKRLASASVGIDLLQAVVKQQFVPTGEVIVWDLETSQRLLTLPGYGTLSLAAGGRRLAAAGLDGQVKVWDTMAGKEVHSFPPPPGLLECVTVNHDGTRLAASATRIDPKRAGVQSEIRLWDVARPEPLFTIRQDCEVNHLTFSPDGAVLASAGSNRKVILWEFASGRQVQVLRGHAATVHEVAFSPDGKWIATAGKDRAVKVWDAATGDERFTLRGHRNQVKTLAFAPRGAGTRLASADKDGRALLWDAAVGAGPQVLHGHTNLVQYLQCSSDGRLASCSKDGTVRIWDVRTSKIVTTLRCSAERVCFSPDGKLLATAGGNAAQPTQPGELLIWEVATGRLLHRLAGHTAFVLTAAFSPDGRRLASASGNPLATPFQPGEVKIWDTEWGQEPITLRPPIGMVTCVTFSPDSQQLALAATGKVVQVCEAATGAEVGTFRGHPGWAYSVAYSPDGKRLASGDSEGIVKVWETNTGQQLQTLGGHVGSVFGLAYSPDGKRLVSASFDTLLAVGETRLWDPELGKEVLTLPGHVAAAFSPDGRYLAAPATGTLEMSSDIFVWDGGP